MLTFRRRRHHEGNMVTRRILTVALPGVACWLALAAAAQAEPLTGTGCVEMALHGDHAAARQQAWYVAIADALRRTHVPDPQTGANLVIVVPRDKVPRLLKRGWLGTVETLQEQRLEQDLCLTIQFSLDAETKSDLARLYGRGAKRQAKPSLPAAGGGYERQPPSNAREDPAQPSVPVAESSRNQSYIALYGGGNFSSSAHNVGESLSVDGVPGSASFSNLSLHNSPVVGAKVGHYFNRYFGAEAEVYTTTPYLKQQAVTETDTGVACLSDIQQGSPCTVTSTTSGAHLRMSTLAVNWVMRYPGKVFQPYVGAGLGAFWLWEHGASTTEGSQVRPGWNLEVGIRAFMTERIALFGEYKFNYAGSLGGQSNSTTSGTGFPIGNGEKADYLANLFIFGIGYHF